jgi:hypothetical protein
MQGSRQQQQAVAPALVRLGVAAPACSSCSRRAGTHSSCQMCSSVVGGAATEHPQRLTCCAHPTPCACLLVGEEACFNMHLGAYGQAYFAAETMEIVSGKGSLPHSAAAHKACMPRAAHSN